MDYIKIRFGKDFDPLGASFERTLEDIFRQHAVSPVFSKAGSWTPPMDICETPEEIILRAEIAGVSKEDLEVEINSRAVRIYGQRLEPPRGQSATYRLAEIQYGPFERILYLPAPIDPEVVSSSYVNGFLLIRLAKRNQAKPHRITITDG
ncbi:MAG: Hsp20/alpha crystallin family protein [Desulfobacteraceae bacterium]|nr:Hsp20/alpha crystallin family protein [Desulfobacteraceae bacterium]